jgi:L-fuculose-phosphate aldolase
VAMGATLAQALELAQEVEVLAEQYAKLLPLGPVKLLSQADMAVVLEKFKSYGRASATK